jgi:hypothetical protein
MIDTIATRRITLNGKTYEKDAVVRMPLQQFQDLEPTGAFARAPAKKKAATAGGAAVKRKKEPAKSSVPAAIVPATPASEPVAEAD